MKVLGSTCGRKMSNTEILVREALMRAEEMGAEVETVRLMDLNIKPCTWCNVFAKKYKTYLKYSKH